MGKIKISTRKLTIMIIFSSSLGLLCTFNASAFLPQYAERLYMTMGCGDPAEAWYRGGVVMANVMNREIPNILVSAVPGDSIVNMRTLEEGETLLVLCIWQHAYKAWVGKPPFVSLLRKARAIINNFPIYLQVVVRKESKIFTINDLVDKKISFGKGSSEEAFTGILAEYGITYEDIMKRGGRLLFLDDTKASKKMADGKLDVLSSTSVVDYPPYVELSTKLPIRLVPQEISKITSLGEKQPGWVALGFPANRYKGQNQAVTLTGGLCGVAAHRDLPDDIVYGITKTLYNYRKEIAEAAPAYRFMLGKDEELLKGIPIPLHPGAERFWAEKGLAKKLLECCR